MLLESYTKKNTFNDRYIMLLHTDQDWKFDLHLLKVVKCHILVNCHTYGLFVQDIQEYCVSGCFYILNLNTKIVFVLENHLCHSFIHVVLFFFPEQYSCSFLWMVFCHIIVLPHFLYFCSYSDQEKCSRFSEIISQLFIHHFYIFQCGVTWRNYIPDLLFSRSQHEGNGFQFSTSNLDFLTLFFQSSSAFMMS